MNKLRGYTEVVIGGKKRPVKFGTNQTILFCQQRGITLKQYAETFDSKRLKALDIDPAIMRDLYWSALVDGARYKKTGEEITPDDVGDWMDTSANDVGEQILEAYLDRARADMEDEAKKK